MGADIETELRRYVREGRHEDVFALALRGYGEEITSTLAACLADSDLAAEAFTVFVDDMWRGIPTFKFDPSFRTWAHTLARRAARRVTQAPLRQPAQAAQARASSLALIDRLEAELRRTTTLLQREAKDAVHAIRDRLADDERELLVLRIDKNLTWLEIAAVLDDTNGTGELTDRSNEATALRGKFDELKKRIRALAAEAGAVPSRAQQEGAR